MADAIRTGVIGYGLAGRIFHALVVDAVEGLELGAIVQRHGDEASLAHPGVTIFRDAQEAIDDPSLQLIVIATPNESHFDLGRRALEAGKHVVIDKPFTLSSADAITLIELSRAKKLVLSAYQSRRWDGDFLTVQEILGRGSLGEVVSFESHIDRWRPQRKPQVWRESGAPGGGILWDLGPHLIDQALVLFGLPQAVFADVRKERKGALMDDAFDVRLYYPKLSVLLRSTCMALVPSERFSIFGNRGCYRKHGIDPQEDALKRGERFDKAGWGKEEPADWGTLTVEQGGGVVSSKIETHAGDYRGYYANVRDAILGVAPLAVTASQAGRVIKVIELARESARIGSAVACSFEEFDLAQ